MKKSPLKRHSLLLMVFVVLLLTGCERLGDARTEFCEALGGVGTQAAEFKSAKVDDPVDEFKGKVETLRDRKERLDKVAEVAPGERIENLSAAIENVAQAVESAAGDTLGPAVDRIQTAGAELESAYLALDDAVCAAK
jgi:hypothetical protein